MSNQKFELKLCTCILFQLYSNFIYCNFEFKFQAFKSKTSAAARDLEKYLLMGATTWLRLQCETKKSGRVRSGTEPLGCEKEQMDFLERALQESEQ